MKLPPEPVTYTVKRELHKKPFHWTRIDRLCAKNSSVVAAAIKINETDFKDKNSPASKCDTTQSSVATSVAFNVFYSSHFVSAEIELSFLLFFDYIQFNLMHWIRPNRRQPTTGHVLIASSYNCQDRVRRNLSSRRIFITRHNRTSDRTSPVV